MFYMLVGASRQQEPSKVGFEVIATRRIINSDKVNWLNLFIGLAEFWFFFNISSQVPFFEWVGAVFITDAVYALLNCYTFGVVDYYKSIKSSIFDSEKVFSLTTYKSLILTNWPRFHLLPFIVAVVYLLMYWF
jgi:hypothetical protein